MNFRDLTNLTNLCYNHFACAPLPPPSSFIIIVFLVMSLFAENGRKLFVTIHIQNVTMNYDSQQGSLGRYECHAYAVGVSSAVKYGFSINVIDSKYNCLHVDT